MGWKIVGTIDPYKKMCHDGYANIQVLMIFYRRTTRGVTGLGNALCR
jgi:hypothetical protein